MFSLSSSRTRSHVSWFLAAAAMSIVIALALGTRARAGNAATPQVRTGVHMAMPMSDAAMKKIADAYWATHPRVGKLSPQTAAAVTFNTGNVYFDSDGNLATQVDTAKITVGQSVLWQWVGGFHTVTNGFGGADPNSGLLFDQPNDATNQQFTFTFNSAGFFPFYCIFHEGLVMKGIVLVRNTTDVPSPRAALGFTAEPAPNPTTAESRFGFALRQSGRVRAEVLDVRGRRVALILDRDLDAGPHLAAWDGRASTGTHAAAGVYYLRLTLPGFAGTRRVVIAR